MKLNDTTTLDNLFALADEWAALPASSLSEQQVALINLKNTVMRSGIADKNGGAAFAVAHACFICVTGV